MIDGNPSTLAMMALILIREHGKAASDDCSQSDGKKRRNKTGKIHSSQIKGLTSAIPSGDVGHRTKRKREGGYGVSYLLFGET